MAVDFIPFIKACLLALEKQIGKRSRKTLNVSGLIRRNILLLLLSIMYSKQARSVNGACFFYLIYGNNAIT